VRKGSFFRCLQFGGDHGVLSPGSSVLSLFFSSSDFFFESIQAIGELGAAFV